ncbi:MAG: TIGR04141 family sporadically distributed protein [Lactobacillaceae bacterium]|jgi:uncharacterized protein (TIGR04141 family)|nr:TIGR04141 family sporadically distributed protein [Lactobacillaceae bacterium]
MEVNKLNIYLIKDGKMPNDIFKDNISSYKSINVGGGNLYYNPKGVNEPDWVQGFFCQSFTDNYGNNIFKTSSSQALFIKNVTRKNKTYTFAITFGTGFHMLKSDSYIPNFGLKCILNLIPESEGLRKISKYDISSTPKQTSEQLSKKGSQTDFNINTQTDILTGVTGTISDKNKRLIKFVGKTISGASSLSLSIRADINNIDTLLRFLSKRYQFKKYENKGFSWIDNVFYVKNDKILLDRLDDELNKKLSNITKEDDKMWIAVPEIIKWENIKGFRYCRKNSKETFDDINLIDLKTMIKKSPNKDFNVERLKNSYIYAASSEEKKISYSWDAFQCLNAEITISHNGKNKTYMLINKGWYEINQDFLTNTNNKFSNFFSQSSGINYIDYNHDDEQKYNEALALNTGFLCLDRKMVSYGGKTSRIEVCDLLDIQNNHLIHIKRYSGSSVLSHLFAQGLISAESLIGDKNFVKKAEKKIKDKYPASNFSFGSNIRNFKIVYAIIAKPQNSTVDIPFFSKVNLNNTCERLCDYMGMVVKFDVIKNSQI